MNTTLLSAAKETAQLAGDTLIKHYGNIEVNNTKSASPVDVVTTLDTDIENFIATQLAKVDPSIGFHGEEFGVRKESNKFWLVDPIDGTAHFIRGIPFCTTMIALVEDVRTLLACGQGQVTIDPTQRISDCPAAQGEQAAHLVPAVPGADQCPIVVDEAGVHAVREGEPRHQHD